MLQISELYFAIKKTLFIVWTLCPGQQVVTFHRFCATCLSLLYRLHAQSDRISRKLQVWTKWLTEVTKSPLNRVEKDFSVLEINSTQNNWADQPGITRMDSRNVSKWRYLTSGVLIIESMQPAISSNRYVCIIFYKDFDVDMSNNFPRTGRKSFFL